MIMRIQDFILKRDQRHKLLSEKRDEIWLSPEHHYKVFLAQEETSSKMDTPLKGG